MSRFALYGMGAVLLDRELTVASEQLEQLGLVVGSRQLLPLEQQQALAQRLGADLQQLPTYLGGSCANSIVTAQLLGSACAFSCRLADDTAGQHYLKHLESCGIHPRVRRVHGHTGSCLVLLSDTIERTLLTDLGVCHHFEPQDVDLETLLDSRWLLIESYLLAQQNGAAAIHWALNHALQHRVKTVLNLSDAVLVRHNRDEILALSQHRLDLIVGNQAEFCALAESDNLETALLFASTRAHNVVITRGGEGALCWNGRSRQQLPAVATEVVSCNGAGDAFAGALIHALDRHLELAAACEFAGRVASAVVAQPGPRLSGSQLQALHLHLP